MIKLNLNFKIIMKVMKVLIIQIINTFFYIINRIEGMNSPRIAHSGKTNKKIYQKYIPLLTQKQIDQKIKILTKRLSRQQVCKQHKLIVNMNQKLQIQFLHLLKLEQLKNIKLQDSLKIINKVPYLTWVRDKNMEEVQNEEKNIIYSNFTKKLESSKKDKLDHLNQKIIKQNYTETSYLKLFYPTAQRTIILTGITKIFTQNAVRQFNAANHSNHNVNNCKKNQNQHQYYSLPCQIVGDNNYWVAVQADSQSTAFLFKKFLRNKKKYCDERKIFNYKQDKKRVRIVLQNQDLYTLLFDTMIQKKNSQFLKRLVNPNSGLFPNMCLRENRRVLAFENQQYQNSLKKINKILYFPIIMNRPQTKQSESTLDEVYSQDFSKKSQFMQSVNSMNDLIQKSDQGTQAESLGIGTHQNQINNVINYEIDKNNKQKQFLTDTNNTKSSNRKQNRQCINDQQQKQQMNLKNRNKLDFQNQSDQEGNIQQLSEIQVKHQKLSKDNQENQSKSQFNQLLFNQQAISQNQQIYNRIQQNLVQPNQDQQNIGLSKITNKSEQKQFNQLLSSVREPLIPPKYLKLYFATQMQTQMPSLSYTKMKRLQIEYKKKNLNRLRLSIPEQFRQISQQQKNRGFFFQNIWKSMQRKSQKKQYIMEFY